MRHTLRVVAYTAVAIVSFFVAIFSYALFVDYAAVDDEILVAQSKEIIHIVPGQALHLLSAVPLQPGKNFANNRRYDLRIDTKSFERTPYTIASTVLALKRPNEVRLTLAADKNGTKPWKVDNFLLLESYVDGTLYAQAFIGKADPIYTLGARVSRIGDDSFEFPARGVTITELVPAERLAVCRVSAFDYGLDATVSDLYLLVEGRR